MGPRLRPPMRSELSHPAVAASSPTALRPEPLEPRQFALATQATEGTWTVMVMGSGASDCRRATNRRCPNRLWSSGSSRRSSSTRTECYGRAAQAERRPRQARRHVLLYRPISNGWRYFSLFQRHPRPPVVNRHGRDAWLLSAWTTLRSWGSLRGEGCSTAPHRGPDSSMRPGGDELQPSSRVVFRCRHGLELRDGPQRTRYSPPSIRQGETAVPVRSMTNA